MFEVIERKVSTFERKIKHECARTDDDKLIHGAFIDYQDCAKLSKERLRKLLAREQKHHTDLIDELKFKKKAWEDEL